MGFSYLKDCHDKDPDKRVEMSLQEGDEKRRVLLQLLLLEPLPGRRDSKIRVSID